ncbi:MAG: hypothetical protein JNM24_17220 [Bdellovibrionaceae bacterium]|nr:hypothetical protein [Pseudobdellovibrionaceae bacterium]
MFYVSLFFLVFCLAATTMADVKKEFGEFRLTHSEKIGNEPVLKRHYSSRSLYRGVFGFNWCSTLDFKISVTDEMSIFDCELGKRISFKQKNSKRFENEENNLKLIIRDHFIVYQRPHTTYFFSMDGRLSHWMAPSQPEIYVIYKGDRIVRLMGKKIGTVNLSYNREGLVQTLGSAYRYEYAQGLLSKVQKTKRSVWQYQYDEFLNMTLWRSPSNFESMKYDSEWDRIVELKDTQACRFRFQYEIKKSKKYIVETKKCATQAEKETVFEMVSPRLLIKSSSDQLGTEFRQGVINENVF